MFARISAPGHLTRGGHAAGLAAASWQRKGDSLRVMVDLLDVCNCELLREEHRLREGEGLGNILC